MAVHYRKKQNTLYGKISEDIESMIARGVYKSGEKLPSIRQMSRNLNVSINTIKEAYSLLENKQLIEGRPQKGFYVKTMAHGDLPISENSDFREPVSREVSENLLYQRILKEVMNPDHVPLGAAIASPSLLPVQDFSSLISSLTEEQRRFCLTYAPTEGLVQLRKAIIRKLIDIGLNLTIEDIVITSGCEEALFLALSAITDPGDTVAIQSPIYCNLVLMFINLGLKIIEIPSDPVKGMYLESLEYAIEHNDIKACLVISNFNNPTGSLIPDENKKKLTEILQDADIPLIEDDVYGDLPFSGKRPSTCRTYDNSGNTLLCSSFSKTISPGLRVGYIIPGKFRDQIIQRKMGANICTSTISQLLLTNYLESGGFYRQLRRLRKEISLRMNHLRKDVSEHFPKGTRMTDPEGGYTLWIELPGGISGLDLYNRAIGEGIAIVPGGLFTQKDYYKNFIRLDAGCYAEDIRWAVKKLGEMAKELLFA